MAPFNLSVFDSVAEIVFLRSIYSQGLDIGFIKTCSGYLRRLYLDGIAVVLGDESAYLQC